MAGAVQTPAHAQPGLCTGGELSRVGQAGGAGPSWVAQPQGTLASAKGNSKCPLEFIAVIGGPSQKTSRMCVCSVEVVSGWNTPRVHVRDGTGRICTPVCMAEEGGALQSRAYVHGGVRRVVCAGRVVSWGRKGGESSSISRCLLHQHGPSHCRHSCGCASGTSKCVCVCVKPCACILSPSLQPQAHSQA